MDARLCNYMWGARAERRLNAGPASETPAQAQHSAGVHTLIGADETHAPADQKQTLPDRDLSATPSSQPDPIWWLYIR